MYSFPHLEPVCCSMFSGPKPRWCQFISCWSHYRASQFRIQGCRGVSLQGDSFVVVQSRNHVWLFANPWTTACQFSCLLLFPGICSNSCPLSQWCHSNISSSVVPTSSCSQSFLASRSFPVSQVFTPGGSSIGVSASATVLTMNIQGWFPLGLISLLSKGLSRVSLSPQFESINSLVLSLRYGPTCTSVQDYWKSHSFDYMDLCWQQ